MFCNCASVSIVSALSVKFDLFLAKVLRQFKLLDQLCQFVGLVSSPAPRPVAPAAAGHQKLPRFHFPLSTSSDQPFTLPH